MNSIIKAHKLYEHSKVELTDVDIQTLAINLDMGNEHGLDANFEKDGQYYQITRHEEIVYDCRDIIDLINITFAITRFIDIGEERQKVA